VAGAAAQAQRLGLWAESGMSVLATVPPQHMYGLESSVLFPLQNGLALHAGMPFFPADICA
jgi:acyl-coenzyme A synthetase/AMP-(fatty) acid ligase